MFTDFISELKDFDPQGYNQWSLQESEFKNQINTDTYLNLIYSGLNSNIFEAKNEFLKSNELVDISFVKIPFQSIDDSLVPVSNSEVSRYIKNNPSDFEQEESRDIQFIRFSNESEAYDFYDKVGIFIMYFLMKNHQKEMKES